MKIVNVKVGELKPYKLNAKNHPQTQIAGIAESIRRFGFTQPVVIDKANEIIIGHGRVAAAELAGLKVVPCIRREDLSKEEIRALRLIDNRIAETGWDQEMLKVEFSNFEFDMTPFNVDFSFDIAATPGDGDAPPDSNDVIDEKELGETTHECPKCRFRW